MDLNQVFQFAMQIQIAIDEAIDSDESIAHISSKDIHEFATEFTTALACVAPAMMYNKLAGTDEYDYLAFNHLANRLCMQLSEAAREKEGGSDEEKDVS